MSTPRTIKASEVRKGMRVRVEASLSSRTTQITEGPVMVDASPYSAEYVELELDGVTTPVAGDHPVTVLAEPEPEPVEGAWYWTQIEGAPPAVRYRVAGGWTAKGMRGDGAVFRDDRDAVTVLGRVLIVDWPGDDVARDLDETYPKQRRDIPADVAPLTSVLTKVADAIRTQGGAR